MKHLAWYTAFLLLLLLGDRTAGYFLQKQTDGSQFRYSRLYRGDAGANILLLGNSRGLSFFQPHIEQITGKTTFNLSYNGLPMDVAKCLVLDYLDRHNAPEVLLLDITMCDRENEELLAGFLCYSKHAPQLDTLIQRKMPKAWWAGQLSALFRFNNEVFQRALYYRNQSDKDWLLDRNLSPAMAAAVAEHSYPLDIHPYLIGQLRETVELARARGLRVELVIGPYFPGFEVRNLDVLKSTVESATGLSVRDYRSALSDPAEFGDFMHPNKRGCLRYVEMLFANTSRQD